MSKLIMKITFIFLLVLIILFGRPLKSLAQTVDPAHILIINQVRGEVCCDKGSLDNLKIQIDAFLKNNIPAYFVLRYDTLKDEKYVSFLKQLSENNNNIIKLGLLLEITPDLAKDSEVNYHGNQSKWYEAQNSYSIGYSFDDNKKIIDTLFTAFRDVYGFYPKVTSSWMIETQTLNYLSKTYGVKLHQITKEQWSTDSYTIYGGPPHYPFPASEKWVLIPDYNRVNAPLIVRQTITDPLYNYGDPKSVFTSQPNDYMRDKKDFEYFKKLIEQAINQPQQTGFGLLGLETSMDEVYQQEYVKQIDYLTKLKEQQRIQFPNLDKLSDYWGKNKISVYWGKDLINNTKNEAFWITTPAYRIRLRLNNNQIGITDIRLFSTEYIDPYSQEIANKEGFWIVPYLIDGSHWYNSSINKQLSQYGIENLFPDIKKDDITNTSNILLPLIKTNQKISLFKIRDNIEIHYLNQSGKSVSLIFNSNSINFKLLNVGEVIYHNFVPKSFPVQYKSHGNGFQLSWLVNNKTSYLFDFNCHNNNCEMIFKTFPELLKDVRTEQYSYMFPEQIPRKLSKEKSILLVHDQYAIADRNPVRVAIIPRDIYNVPSLLAQPPKIVADPSIKTKISNTDKIYFIDFLSDKPGKADIQINLTNDIYKQAQIYFAPNCKSNMNYCLAHPQEVWWYFKAIIGDKFRHYLQGEKQ